MKNEKNIKFELFTTFLKIGAFTFGGGYAMIPLIKREIVENKKWMSDDEILDMVAISESTPGPFAVNAATFVGYQTAGTFGAACATFGVVLPSFVIILLLSFVLKQFEEMKAVQYAFEGIRAGILVMIVSAMLSMKKSCEKNLPAYLIMAAAFVAVGIFQISAVLVLFACAIGGLAAGQIRKRRQSR